MSRAFPVCPRCEGRDVVPCDELLEASDRSDSIRSTHQCRRCHERFRFTPPSSSSSHQPPAPRA